MSTATTLPRMEPPGCCVVRLPAPDSQAAERDARVFAALGDPVRLAIARLLARHPALCVCEIQGAFDLAQPTISHHLKVLRDAGLVEVARRGTWAYYSLRRDTVKRLAQGLVEVL
ncbi:MAG: metalloregulator ArsR/SmtB family transcription factor [Armatimonadota bacterium]|nr:metalloregulator ArsR/SmtB family transcription factor [Armatimonadota bacterium]MDR5696138.1 metalloregulator ArsR/SmtB family transcription factor [Armatimonadota bacterium]